MTVMKKNSKPRLDEDDASACIRKFKECFKVTDFEIPVQP